MIRLVFQADNPAIAEKSGQSGGTQSARTTRFNNLARGFFRYRCEKKKKLTKKNAAVLVFQITQQLSKTRQ